jgi:cell division protein FtsB
LRSVAKPAASDRLRPVAKLALMRKNVPDPSSSPAAAAPRRRGLGRRLVPKLILLATFILIVDALVGDKGLLERIRENQRSRQVAETLEKMKHENAQLREQANRLREEEPNAIEAAARKQLGMIKPGEMLFIIKDTDQPQAPAPQSSTPATPPAPSADKPTP